MKKFLFRVLLVISILILPSRVYAAGSVTVSRSSISMNVGTSTTFNIVASNAVGSINVVSSNPSVATVSIGSTWIENQTITVTVTGKSVGSATISVQLTDVATFDEEVLSGTRTINVSVNQPAPSQPSQPSQPAKPSQPADTRSNNTNLKSVQVNGREVSKKDGQYVLEVSNYINTVDIKAVCEDGKAKVTGTGKKDIINGNNSYDLVVTAENGRTTTHKLVVVRKEYNLLSDLDDILKQGIDADIVISKEDKLTNSDLDKIKNNKNKITLKAIDEDKVLYKWILDSNISSVNEFNPNIGLEIEDNDDMGKAMNYPDGIYLDFRNCKDIPNGAVLRYYVSNKYKDGDKINIYIYDENTKKVTELKNGLTVTEGYVEFEISKSLRHVITKANVGGSVPVEEEGLNIWLVVSIVLGLLLVICLIGLITKKGNKEEKVTTKTEEIKPVVNEVKPTPVVDIKKNEVTNTSAVTPVATEVTTSPDTSGVKTVSPSDIASALNPSATTDTNSVPEITGVIPVEEVAAKADETKKI